MKDPLKQGLKHISKMRLGRLGNSVEVKDPLKQGLKLRMGRIFKKVRLQLVEVKDPLKQGLKQNLLLCYF